jgi:hypothetical protein
MESDSEEIPEEIPPTPRKRLTSRDTRWIQPPDGLPTGDTEYHIRGVIQPLWPFGLPDQTATAFKLHSVGTLTFPTDWGTHWGALPEYRSLDEQLSLELDLGSGVTGQIQDNNLMVRVVDADPESAFRRAHAAVEAYLDHLTLSHGTRFSFTPTWMQTADEVRIPVQLAAGKQALSWYDLSKLRDDFVTGQRYASLTDPQLLRALDYYVHAFLLQELAHSVDERTRHREFINVEIFLNVWKALTTILGDPSHEAKRYQVSYKTLGLSHDFFRDSITPLKGIRDSSDVAHHDLSRETADAVADALPAAFEVAREVIRRYRDRLVAAAPADK